MDLFDQVSEDIKNAMKAKDKVALETLRNIKKFFLEAKTAPGANDILTDDAALKIIQKLVKQGKDSAEIYIGQGRQDLADVELGQVAVMEKYLPKQMSAEELEAALKEIIAETGAGQHGVATATVAALFDMECVVYMGAEDVERQSLNAYRMELLGAKVHAVESGTRTLKDAINEAMRDWATNIETTFYCIGSVMGPHPYPTMVRDFQKIIGEETKEQMKEIEGKLPDAVFACVGGGSNAMGMFYDFIPDESVRLIGAEAAGRGIDTLDHAATIAKGSKGIFHGMKSLFLQNEEGQIDPVYSISAGLDYPGIGPEHAHLHEIGRAEYMSITDEQAVKAFEYLSKTEGVIPAIESSHAVAAAMEIVPTMSKDQSVVICLSGRGDKDVYQVARYRGVQLDEN